MRKQKRQRRSEGAADPCEELSGAGEANDASRVWIPELIEHFAVYLGPNEVACSLRLVSKLTAKLFSGICTIHLSQPVPPWAFQQWLAGARNKLTREHLDELACLTAASDVTDNLELALTAAGSTEGSPRRRNTCFLIHAAFAAAARAGSLNSCRYIADRAGPCSIAWDEAASSAAECAQRSAVDLCLQRCPSPSARVKVGWSAAAGAARGGHVELMSQLLAEAEPEPVGERAALNDITADAASSRQLRLRGSERHQPTRNLCLAAIGGCDLATVRQLCTAHFIRPHRWIEYEMMYAMAAALYSPTPDWKAKVDWVIEEMDMEMDMFLDVYSSIEVERMGEAVVERFQYAKGMAPQGIKGRELAPAVRGGNVAAVLWLLAEGVEVGPKTAQRLLREAAGAGQVAMLKALQELGWDLKPRALITAAASGGHLGVMRPDAFTGAAGCASLAAMRWLWSHDCGMREGALEAAAASGCEAAVELLAELGCPMPADGAPYLAALRLRDPRLMAALWDAGVPFGPDKCWLLMRGAEAGATLEALQALLERGCPPPRSWAAAARELQTKRWREGRGAVLDWMWGQHGLQHGGEGAEGEEEEGQLAFRGDGVLDAWGDSSSVYDEEEEEEEEEEDGEGGEEEDGEEEQEEEEEEEEEVGHYQQQSQEEEEGLEEDRE
ncbi:hypothetical protein HYH03_001656 [Edaphochlamys debaryana]|uniref:Ankyrin repeat domain-containing protein n=1 Tax=Edaphochlamys debaryana TaxID=47281 RepID=A0A835YDF2_9CHLO|nr:hypothetical protein HYH03_001656 [Edaphochlamys debaryana]|eukprot:KAG2500897.1 hypothetical protein HYH03_001656 [Edaphochlamys debaryana]